MSPNPSFLDWLKDEVEPKLRIAASHFENTNIPSYLIGQAVATGVKPFLYWQRDNLEAPPVHPGKPTSSTPGPLPVAGSLSHALALPQVLVDELSAQQIDVTPQGVRPRSYMGPALWRLFADKLKPYGLKWNKEEKAWTL